CLQGSYWPFTF
nr:immunoglobulin light chain junction region [Macaca mulatta]